MASTGQYSRELEREFLLIWKELSIVKKGFYIVAATNHPIPLILPLDRLNIIGSMQVKISAYLPHTTEKVTSSPWLVLLPGATTSAEAYYNCQLPTYSMVEYLTQRGIGCALVDTIGTGQNTLSSLDGTLLTREV